MASQWENFLRNCGAWHGTFASLDAQQQEQSRTSSILTLEHVESERLVRFGLKRWEDASLTGPAEQRGEPCSAMQQDYRTLGRQVLFFPSGTFCKGSQQLAPGTAFGGEFGFIEGDRRHRLVILYSDAGSYSHAVLIREFRAGSNAVERPPLSVDQLLGHWQGQEATITPDWPEASLKECQCSFTAADLAGVRCLPDGGGFRVPEQVSHRQAFSVEAWWMYGDDQLEQLVRSYDATGAWASVRQRRFTRSS
ncbi:MAG: DUF3598 family protein [Synechococcus sp.]|nr:DUF3598 family protein [Synechococcus sp.]